ncbi:MAG TPA: DUF2510 domain-containing protein [Acidimicrobiales bacterium]|nr:DUF2510 domain-containing protein [Acidimicrobiales bacterium]
MARRAHPPAWYPDPRDPARLRRWDGRVWTTETRPFPEWLRTLELSPGPGRRGRSRSRRLWMASLSLLAVAVALVWVREVPAGLDRERITDTAFVTRANSVCAGVASTVYADTRHHSDAIDDAARLRELDAGWSRMVNDLDAIRATPAAGPKVDEWRTQWREVVRLLGVYADEIEANGRPTPATSRALNRAKQRVDRFAYVNGMNSCLFI